MPRSRRTGSWRWAPPFPPLGSNCTITAPPAPCAVPLTSPRGVSSDATWRHHEGHDVTRPGVCPQCPRLPWARGASAVTSRGATTWAMTSHGPGVPPVPSVAMGTRGVDSDVTWRHHVGHDVTRPGGCPGRPRLPWARVLAPLRPHAHTHPQCQQLLPHRATCCCPISNFLTPINCLTPRAGSPRWRHLDA